MHRVAFGVDVTKMYRQIFVNEADLDFQRILWWDNSSELIKEYRLNTVTYGTISYIATRCLAEIAKSIEAEFPVAAKTITTCFYMDDLLCGADSVEEAIQRVIHSTLLKFGFPLQKYI